MSLAQASLSDLEDVRNVLVKPLSGKSVMIPFTSKAFFPGVLQPEQHEQGGGEHVLVKLSKQNFLETSRSEAIDIVEKRMKVLNNEIKGDNPATGSGNNTGEPLTTTTSNALPYFEIREELDASGSEIRAEAINVAKELEFLQKKGKEMSQTSLKPPQTDDDVSEPGLDVESEPKQQKGGVTDEEYESIVSRLDALAALEEESTSQKTVNKKSAKKLQGSGWAKGFLNKKSTKKKAAPPPTKVEQESAATPRKVVFGDNQVKEIPRVGERSVTSLKKAPAAVQPFSPNVFTGVVQERPAKSSAAAIPHQPEKSTTRHDDEAPRKLSRFAQQRMEQQNESAEGPKKISRFAQDRAKLRGEKS